jgi:diaminohydroxyphosphoribosylaminopyrimidine deaminase/5-amino-6-(5-phosphoribosylamino)uracil reductase
VARGAVGGRGRGALGLDRLAEAPRYHLEKLEQIGPDALSLWARIT